MMSSLTSAPASITFFAARPIAVPALTAARSMSPVEICGMPYFWQICVACVPLPAPGAPRRMSLMEWFAFALGGCWVSQGQGRACVHRRGRIITPRLARALRRAAPASQRNSARTRSRSCGVSTPVPGA